ncbi:MAG: glycoside hydrolase family 3 C-terminal domain-containing protein [Lachnospiraceae bacterium]|nr:glycoside hydrolase family 3 C-terminal domain-containing protein [Lachnospiraceae bacterium]
MNSYQMDMDRYKSLARKAVAEGCVLLENEGNALPVRKGEKVAVYGRMAFHYYKSGLGSGGMVNTHYTVGILDALKSCETLSLDQKLLDTYEAWIQEHPYDEGKGWGQVPWSQKEMPVTDEMLEAATRSDLSLIVIGRTAGEDQDNKPEEGSYELTGEEKELIRRVCGASDRTAVLLNVGNIIDMKWVKEYHPQAVLYVWQGGQEGGNGVLDVLTGKTAPCGKLTDTIACDIADYPSTQYFGNEAKNYYSEDIYVGYRYFETFAREKVLYPFGYGRSYTEFSVDGQLTGVTDRPDGSAQDSCAASDGSAASDAILLEAVVKNTGTFPGKEVVQVYTEKPQGKLGNPARALVAFAKTKELAPGETQKLCFSVPKRELASYDDSGCTGHPFCYVIEEGSYQFYIGTDVRSARFAGSRFMEFEVAEQLSRAYAPVEAFQRMRPISDNPLSVNKCQQETAGSSEPTAATGQNPAENPYRIGFEPVPAEASFPAEDLCEENNLPCTGDQGYRLVDVLDGKISLDQFAAQLNDEDLLQMFLGEGMCSAKVTPGTAAAFGGVTDRLQNMGIPAACCSDGPSGIRMDCGTKAFSLPNGTLLGCTFNEALVGELFEMTGLELRLNQIDSLLGPGMNIHRNPLNGRNFEYISEDPYVTGKIAAAQVAAMRKWDVSATIKHFCANNQEWHRRNAEGILSERALREIYLKGFEIAVKEGGARSVMTTYGPVNGLWTAGSYDLCTKILREEWGFDGIVMTDWWAEANEPGQPSAKTVKAPMIAAQNDLYMCVPSSENDPDLALLSEQLKSGRITRGQLVRNAKNILRFLLHSPAMQRICGRISGEEREAAKAMADQQDAVTDLDYFSMDASGTIVLDGSLFHPKAGETETFGITLNKMGLYSISLELQSDLGSLAQLSLSIFIDNRLNTTVSLQGLEGRVAEEKRELGFQIGSNHYMRFYYGANGLNIQKAVIRLEKEFNPRRPE